MMDGRAQLGSNVHAPIGQDGAKSVPRDRVGSLPGIALQE